MKKRIFSLSLIMTMLFTGLLLVSCSDDDDNNDNGNGSESESVIIVKTQDRSYSYKYNTSAASTSNVANKEYQVLVFDGSSSASNYGSYNGANLAISYYLQGEGEYRLVETTEDFIASAGSKVMHIRLLIGNGNSTGSRSFHMMEGKATVKIIDQKYHITIGEPVPAQSFLTIGDASGIAESVSLTLKNIYNHN
jgi:hypothetical protein